MYKVNLEYHKKLSKNLQNTIDLGHAKDELVRGIICNYEPFYVIAKNSSEEVSGVLAAYTAFSEIYIDDLFVFSEYRNKGIGKALLEFVESYFEDRGYNNINLCTSEAQAPKFYQKCGFELEFVRQNKINPKLTKYFFIKYFKNTQQDKGVI